MKLEKTNADIAAYGEKYHFYYHEANRTIVCTTMYKGQMVRGIAKCNPEDTIDIDTGKNLSYLRCYEKYSRKKAHHARKAYNEAVIAKAIMDNKFRKATDFVNDSEYQLVAAKNALIELEQKLHLAN